MRRSNARSPAAPDPPSSATTAQMGAPAFHFRPPPPSTFSFLSRIGAASGSPNKQPRGGFCVPIIAGAAAATFLFLFLWSQSPAGDRRFGIVIDGGSTGTRIHVFAYVVGRGGAPVLDLGAASTMRASPGLSAYADEPERAGESLAELLEFGRRRVPRSQWGETEVRLMATAGLRLLETRVQEMILESCRKVLKVSGFQFQSDWASVISGADEGIYAWVSANYAIGTLGGDPQHTTGIIELGGASAQVTFVSSEPLPPEFSHVLQFGKTTYNLYSHSFLHFGQNVAHESLRALLRSGELKSDALTPAVKSYIDPCTPRGYSGAMGSVKPFIGVLTADGADPNIYTAGNFSECRSAALMLLQRGKDNCVYRHCRLGSTFVPALQGKFLATENFFFTSKFFGLGSTALLSDFVMAGERFCGEDWTNLKRKYHYLGEDDLLRYCFSSSYIVALLHDSLGVALDEKRIVFSNQVSSVPLDWALGAFVMHKMAGLNAEHRDWTAGVIGGDSSALILLFVISAALILMAWSMSRWRKPQLKTIYDLEKGRYLVTRVTR
uniref:Ectonucleoside triphosphate diphosphohydrolase 1 n=1 Tax=Anthurium amnicola TaxID=1678845 RepID=A0A1D1ZIS5_9ARAE